MCSIQDDKNKLIYFYCLEAVAGQGSFCEIASKIIISRNQFNGLVIIFKFDATPVDNFFRVFLLFFCEHVLVELLLQFFVCIVNV